MVDVLRVKLEIDEPRGGGGRGESRSSAGGDPDDVDLGSGVTGAGGATSKKVRKAKHRRYIRRKKYMEDAHRRAMAMRQRVASVFQARSGVVGNIAGRAGRFVPGVATIAAPLAIVAGGAEVVRRFGPGVTTALSSAVGGTMAPGTQGAVTRDEINNWLNGAVIDIKKELSKAWGAIKNLGAAVGLSEGASPEAAAAARLGSRQITLRKMNQLSGMTEDIEAERQKVMAAFQTRRHVRTVEALNKSMRRGG